MEELSGHIHSDAADCAEHNNVIVIMENTVLVLFTTASITIATAKSYDYLDNLQPLFLRAASSLVGVLLERLLEDGTHIYTQHITMTSKCEQ